MPDPKTTRAPEVPRRDRPVTAKLPIQESQQPDPMLQMSTGAVGVGWLTAVALAIAVILGIVFYGLNGGGRSQPTAAAPPAPSAPAAGGRSAAPTPTAPRTNASGTNG